LIGSLGSSLRPWTGEWQGGYASIDTSAWTSPAVGSLTSTFMHDPVGRVVASWLFATSTFGIDSERPRLIVCSANGTLDQQRRMYYSASWQLLQEDVGSTIHVQYYWGLRHIDDP
jgi:hypothetical protein